MDDLEILWQKARAIYEQRTERKLDGDPAFSQFRTLDDLSKALDVKQMNFQAYREKNRHVYTRLARALGPLKTGFMLIQKGVQNSPYAPLSVLLGAFSYLLDACQSVTKSYDGVETLFDQIANLMTRFAEYDVHGAEESLKAKITGTLAYILEITGKVERVIRRNRYKQWFREVFVQDADVTSSVDGLKRYIEQELGLVATLTYGRVRVIQEVTEDVQQQVNSIRTDVSELVTRQNRGVFSPEDEALLSEMLPTTTLNEIVKLHYAKLRSLTKDTGLWLQNDPMWKRWEEGDASILWVFGTPGVGKTMLAARTIETLQTRHPELDTTSRTSICYLYFKDDNFKLRSCADMFKTAALQATKSDAQFKKHVINKIKANPTCLASPELIWENLFLDYYLSDQVSASTSPPAAFLIIDGLDEAPESDEKHMLTCLATLVQRISSAQRSQLRIAMFCRPSVRASLGFDPGAYQSDCCIEVTADRNNDDIKAFIKYKLEEVTLLNILKKQKMMPKYRLLAKQIFSSVQARSQGMFLWASLMFDQLKNCPSPEAITAALAQAPSGIDEMLHHLFKKLDAEGKYASSYMSHLLSWVYWLNQPMTIADLFVLIFTTSGQQCITLSEDLRGRLSSLFEIVSTGGVIQASDTSASPSQGTDEEVEQVPDDSLDFLEDEDDEDFDLTNKQDFGASSQNANEQASAATTDKEAHLEASFELPKIWRQMTVKFSHISIKDFLQREGNPRTRRWDDCSILPDDLASFHQTVVITCLQIIKSELPVEYQLEALRKYCKLNWPHHLKTVEWNHKSDSDTHAKAVRSLSDFFFNGQHLLESYTMVELAFEQTWFHTNEYSDIVMKMLAENIGVVSPTSKSWAAEASRSKKILLQPLQQVCAQTWLERTGWDDPRYAEHHNKLVNMMLFLQNLRESGVLPSDRISMWELPPEAIETCAEVVPLPRTVHWCTAVGWMLHAHLQDKGSELALEHFERALVMSPDGWSPLLGMAHCYARLKDFDKASMFLARSVEHIPRSAKFANIVRDCDDAKIAWMAEGQDPTRIIELTREAYENCGIDTATEGQISNYVKALYRGKAFDELLVLLRTLHDHPSQEDEPYKTRLALWLVQQIEVTKMLDLARLLLELAKIVSTSEGKQIMELIKTTLKKACAFDEHSGEDRKRFALAYFGTVFLSWCGVGRHDGRSLLDDTVSQFDLLDSGRKLATSFTRDSMADHLGQVLLDNAMDAREAGEDPSKWTGRMESLTRQYALNRTFYRASKVSLALGLWLQRFEKASSTSWRARIRPSLNEALCLLDDDDPQNDQEAYFALGNALMAAGDYHNAAIALGIVASPEGDAVEQVTGVDANLVVDESPDLNGQPDLEKKTTGVHQSEDLGVVETVVTRMDPEISAGTVDTDGQIKVADDQIKSGIEKRNTKAEAEAIQQEPNFRYSGFRRLTECDGPCELLGGQRIRELYRCHICLGRDFCQDCFKLIKTDNVGYRVCSSTHEHIRYWPLTGDAKRILDAILERNFEPLQQWLNELRATWSET